VTVEKARLREFARTRWGEEWFLETQEHADGDEYYQVHHTEELVADGIVIRDIANVEDGDVNVKRKLVNTREYVAEIEIDGT
jgi:hypothetical protein